MKVSFASVAMAEADVEPGVAFLRQITLTEVEPSALRKYTPSVTSSGVASTTCMPKTTSDCVASETLKRQRKNVFLPAVKLKAAGVF